MRKLSALIVVALLTLAGSARAQEEAPAAAPAGDAAAAPAADVAPAPAPAPAAGGMGLIIGADFAFQLPLGNMADATGMGFGGLVRGEYKLMPNLNLTLRAGYIYSLKKEQAGVKFSVNNIPIWVGGKFFITDMIYAGAEVGVNMMTFKSEGSLLGISMEGSSSENKFGGNVGAGVLLGDLDVRAQLLVMDFGHSGDSMAVMINVGYNFLKL
jgi:hypothetical protein